MKFFGKNTENGIKNIDSIKELTTNEMMSIYGGGCTGRRDGGEERDRADRERARERMEREKDLHERGAITRGGGAFDS